MKDKKLKKEKIKFYSLDNILKYDCQYYIIIGERSNGKTYAMLNYALQQFYKTGKQTAYIRRYDTDIKKNLIENLFENLILNDELKKIFKGKYTTVIYSVGKFYLGYYEINKDGEEILYKMDSPFMYVFSVNNSDKYRSRPYPNITTILFEEFMSHDLPLPNEFISFTSILSTIIRLRTDVKIFMVSNTINPYSLYFEEMGIDITKLKKGNIEIYEYNQGKLKVAVEFSDFDSSKKESNVYFGFDNPKLKMITDGSWEIGNYPHLTIKYKPCDVKYKFFIKYKTNIIQGNLISINENGLNNLFIYFHNKTTEIKDDKSLIFDLEPNTKINYRTRFYNSFSVLENLIYKCFELNKVFYQNNTIGNIIECYINDSKLI